jgi:hypothetical protein
LRAEDFSIAAAALHASGQIDADFSGPHPILSARVDASSLTLPRFDARSQAPLPIDALANWRGQMALHADQVSWGATTVASQASVDLAGSGGIVTAYVKDARIAGGHFEGAIAIDMPPPGPLAEVHADLTGAAMDGLPSLPPLSFTGGSIDFTTNLSATGYSPTALLATMSGDAHATVHGSALLGVNLPQLTGLLAAPVPKLRAALTSSMADGDTGPLSGHATAVLQQGAVTLRRARLSGDAGSVDIEGSIDLAARTANLALEFQPAVTDPPTLGLRLAGPWQGGRRAVDVRPALLWAGAGTAKKARGSAPRTPSR